MYHPTSRVLTVLELLQFRSSLTGPELAKVSRVLPQQARERLQAVSSHLVLFPHNEQDDTWKCRRFFTNFQELCARFGIDEDDLIWQCKVQTLPAQAGAEDSGWIPFCMF